MRNLPVLWKCLIIVGVMALCLVGVSGIALTALDRVHTATERMDEAATEALTSMRLTASVMAMNRAQYLMAADPRHDSLIEAEASIRQEADYVRERLENLIRAVNGNQRAAVEDLANRFDTYVEGLEATLAIAQAAAGDVQIDVAQAAIMDQVRAVSPLASDIRERVGRLAAIADDQVTAEATAASDAFTIMSRLTLAAVLIALIGGSAIGAVIGDRGISRPLRRIVGTLKALGSGDLTVQVTFTDRTDEVGDIAKAIETFRTKLVRAEEMDAVQAREQEARLRRGEELERLIGTFDQSVQQVTGRLISASERMQSNAGDLTDIAERTNERALAVSGSAEEASANVQTVAAATEELATAISEINRQVGEATTAVERASDRAGATSQTMTRLNGAAERIGDVVTLIQSIAQQTNLLALNATIEAARAGEAGKGFAVVASEVKSLAGQTAKATEDISSQVADIQDASSDAIGAIDTIVAAVQEINHITTVIASAVEQQGSATQEISHNVQQAAQGTQHVADTITDVRGAAERTGTMAADTHASATDLNTQAESLKDTVEHFLLAVRSA